VLTAATPRASTRRVNRPRPARVLRRPVRRRADRLGAVQVTARSGM